MHNYNDKLDIFKKLSKREETYMGKKGFLTIKGKTHFRDDKKPYLWVAYCSCGHEHCIKKLYRTTAQLKNMTDCGQIALSNKICGGIPVPWFNQKEKGSAYNIRVRPKYRHRYYWAITIEYVAMIFKRQGGLCPKTGRRLVFSKKDMVQGTTVMASLDRIDNERGYVEGNIQIVCWKYNDMKGCLSEEEADDIMRICKIGPNGETFNNLKDKVAALRNKLEVLRRAA